MPPDTTTTTEETKTAETTQTTEKAPTRAYRPGFDIPVEKPMTPEDDPNHKMSVMLSRRTKKTEAKEGEKGNETEAKTEKTAETTAKDGEKTETKPLSGLADLLSQNLKFRAKDGTKTTEKAKEEVKTEAKEEKTETNAAKTETKDQKTVVTKKKVEPTTADHMRIMGETAAAAASAAVTAAMPKVSTQQTKSESPEDSLQDDYKRDYEIAKHLATIDARYKDAPQKILAEHARVEDYARRWEQANPGKVFDPAGEDHNEFYASIERPWSDDEFVDARADMIAERKAAQKVSKLEEKQKAIEEREAKRELSGAAAQTVNTVAMLLAKNVDETAHELIVKDPQGFAKLQDNDPITADALVEALNALAPRIETAVLVDDPQQRISFDHKNNRDHKEWLDYLYDKEAQYAGQADDRGRIFASRNEFVKLPPAQQARRWYLTADHLISEMVADKVIEVKDRIQKERERGKKVAAALGYVPKESKNGETTKEAQKSDVTKTTETKKEETTTTTDTKPVSPSVGSGAKIDTQGEGKKTPFDDLWGKTGKILFGR